MMRQLMTTMLHPSVKKPSLTDTTVTVAKFAAAGDVGAQAAGLSGFGLDLYGGECVLAGVRWHDQPRGYQHMSVMALTNRRTIVGGYSSAKGELNAQGFAVAHDELLGVQAKSSLLTTQFSLLTPAGPRSMAQLYVECKEIEGVFQALLSQPPGTRGEPPTAPIMPNAADVTGALGAMQALWTQDAEAYQLLQTIDANVRAARLTPPDGEDLAARTVLWHRSRASGPASYGAAYLSPLGADDFANVLTSVLGQPLAYQQPRPGMHTLDFAIDPKRDALSPALSALGIASYFGLGFGFSPGQLIAAQMLAKRPTTQLRVVYGDVKGGCSYEMYANSGVKLETVEAMMAHGVHQLLIHSAGPILSRRAQVGWGPRYGELFA